jgi:uncharacterized protein
MSTATDPTQQDLNWLNTVMGRPLFGDFKIASRRKDHFPQVLQVPPVVEGKPFPSLYWLCCPDLKKAIDQIESQGDIKKIEDWIKTDPHMINVLHKNTQNYIKLRLDLMRETDWAQMSNENMAQALREKGIGGLADYTRIRCLHMHYAYSIIHPNEFGDYLNQRYHLNELV